MAALMAVLTDESAHALGLKKTDSAVFKAPIIGID
jgi:hypothetical protein